jgi:RHS repeat-associated protein
MQNAKGRDAEAYTVAHGAGATGTKLTDEGFSYDALGRKIGTWEITPHLSAYTELTASYFANGNLETLSNGQFGYTITYTPDGEGRLATAVNQVGAVIVAGTTYNAASQPTIINIGSGTDQDDYGYDPNTGRMKTYTFQVGSTGSVAGTLNWNQNGTLQQLGIVDGYNSGGTQTCTFSYDGLARIGTDNCGSVWDQTFSYDPYGNVTKSANGGISWMPGYNANNQYTLTGTSYDADGNLLTDTFHTYTWNSAGKVATIDSSACGTNGECVTYDAFGRTAEVSSGSEYNPWVYFPNGNVALYFDDATLHSYLPLPGGATLYINGSSGNYVWHNDWLGSARLGETLVNSTVLFDRAFAAFGEEYQSYGNAGQVSFTGDTQNIVAGTYDTPYREMNPNQGRWISPDPSGLGAVNLTNPQTWNRYAYVANNPLTRIIREWEEIGRQKKPPLLQTC